MLQRLDGLELHNSTMLRNLCRQKERATQLSCWSGLD